MPDDVKTRVIRIDSHTYEEGILEGARILAEGGLVAFPTETVYGIGASAADPRALARLEAVKKRPPGRPFTHLVSRLQDVRQLVAGAPPGRLARKLMRRFWPGPLTLVLPAGDDRWVGVRMPGLELTLLLVARSRVDVVAPSANLTGQDAARDAEQVMHDFDGKVDLVLDGGRVSGGRASTVVRVDANDRWEIQREGPVDGDAVRLLEARTLLLVCSGNTCRSPMAEGICKRLLADRHCVAVEDLGSRRLRVVSAGLSAMPSSPAIPGTPYSADAVRVLAERGVDLSGGSSQAVTLDLATEADDILVMTESHRRTLLEWVPEVAGLVRLLDPDGGDIDDPIGGSLNEYRRTADQIETAARRRLEDLSYMAIEGS